LPSQTSNANKVLVTDGTNASWQYAGLGSGSLGTNNVILGRGKPGTITTANDNLVIGAYTTGSALSTGTGNTFGRKQHSKHFEWRLQCDCSETICMFLSGAAQGIAALGTGSSIFASYQIAIGQSVNAQGTGAVCVGYATGNGTSDICIGYQAQANAANTVVVGKNSNAGTGAATTILGSSSGKSTLTGVNNTVIETLLLIAHPYDRF
jgi:hypothetical protein